MPGVDFQRIETLKQFWTDRRVKVVGGIDELKRFEGKIGRVVTVNGSGKAIVDFSDGAWYDIEASEEFLKLATEEEATRFDGSITSAQAHPARQGS